MLVAEGGHAVHLVADDCGCGGRITDFDAIVLACRLAERRRNEAIDNAKVRFAVGRARQYHGHGHVTIGRLHENTEQEQQLLGCTGTARKNHDRMCNADERF